MQQEDLDRIKRVVASYPDAPTGIEDYLWLPVPRYWDHLRVPTVTTGPVLIHPLHEDQHAGIRFRVGWDVRERVVALWSL